MIALTTTTNAVSLSWLIPQNTFTREPLKGDRKQAYDDAKNQAKNPSDPCKKFLSDHKINVGKVIATMNNQRAFDGTTSSISIRDAGLDPTGNLIQVAEWFEDPNNFAWTARFPQKGSGAKLNDVFFGIDGLNARTILHEALHAQTGLDDDALANQLGVTRTKGILSSEGIDKILHANGCF